MTQASNMDLTTVSGQFDQHPRQSAVDAFAGGARNGVGSHKSVFIVEDEALIAMDLEFRLADLGYTVCGKAGRGDAALKDIAATQPDVVLMDINIAGDMSGLDVARALRQSMTVPIIFLTAYSSSDVIAAASEYGAYGFLVKPFEERELHTTIQVALTRGEFDMRLRELNASLEERVKARTTELEQANQAKDQFLRNISHEMRTPLNHVLGMAQVLSSLPSVNANKSAAKCADQILNAGWNLANHIEALLDLKDTQLAPAALELCPVAIGAVVGQALTLVGDLAVAKNIDLNWNSSVDMSLVALVDQDRLLQILIALLSNAIKYNRSGGSVDITLFAQSEFLALSITDSGHGMTEEEQSRALEPFARFLPKDKVIGGIGIGLTVANRIATSMGGSIAMQSEPGNGTTAVLRLPRAKI
ncbi:MAG: response regulator [Burkholderiales bacterium]